jgi:penicillin-binding protein 2
MSLRIKFIFAIFFIVWGVLLVKIYYLSIKSNRYYELLAQKNTLKVDYIPQVRGIISDRNGEPIAVNRLGFSINLTPHLKKDELEKLVNHIVDYFPALDAKKLIRNYKSKNSVYNHENIKIVNFVPYNEMLEHYSILNIDKDIEIKAASRRFYPNKDIASHLIGYVAKANKKDLKNSTEVTRITHIIGKSGVEKYYNDFLEGKLGYRKYKVTAKNEEIEQIEKHISTKDNNIQLTVDMRLQKYIHNMFTDKSGVVVVMDATNGDILSAGSFPEYDINMFVDGISHKNWQMLMNDFNHPFTNKIINGIYPPGSVVKMGVGISFLENGLSPYDQVFCSGSYYLGGRNFRCWKEKGHGTVNLTKAIRESCDDYFYKHSLKVGINKISETLTGMGFGNPTGVDLPNEFMGTVPNKLWKKRKYNQPWYMGETMISSIGQGYFLVTPLQVAVHTALLATGMQPVPHLIRKFGDEEYKPIIHDNLTPIQKEKLPLVRKGMYQVTNHPNGTATRHLYTRIKISGKTGTAQVIGIPQEEKKRMKESELKYYQRSHAWLTTYAPAKNPKYVVTVLVEHGGHGGTAGGGIVSKIINKMHSLGYFRDDVLEAKR